MPAVGVPLALVPPPPAPVDDDIETRVLRALDRGDAIGAQRLLVHAYGARVRSFCIHLLADAVVADDVAQEVLIQAGAALPTFRRESHLLAWLLAIARHRCLDSAKATTRRRRTFVPEAESKWDAPGDSLDPGEGLDIGRQRVALEQCVGRLTAPVRAALLLHYLEGLSFREMGPLLGEKPATLQARVARAMPLLRACLLSKGTRP